jgi:hypothetical protein
MISIELGDINNLCHKPGRLSTNASTYRDIVLCSGFKAFYGATFYFKTNGKPALAELDYLVHLVDPTSSSG